MKSQDRKVILKGEQFRYRTHLSLRLLIIIQCILILFFLNGCSENHQDGKTNSKAIKGIAFLVLDANFNESTAPGTKEGIKYSEAWLHKQTDSLKTDLEMRCNVLSQLVIDLNMSFLKEMIDEPNLPYLLEDSTRQELESILAQNPDFNYEWTVFKRDQTSSMKPQIVEYKNQLKANDERRSFIVTETKKVYLQSQPLLLAAMQQRIRYIFGS